MQISGDESNFLSVNISTIDQRKENIKCAFLFPWCSNHCFQKWWDHVLTLVAFEKTSKPLCDPTLTNCFQHLPFCRCSLDLLSKSVCWIWVEFTKSFKSIKTMFSGGQKICQKLFPGPTLDLSSATRQVFCLLATYLKLFGNASYFLIAYKEVK